MRLYFLLRKKSNSWKVMSVWRIQHAMRILQFRKGFKILSMKNTPFHWRNSIWMRLNPEWGKMRFVQNTLRKDSVWKEWNALKCTVRWRRKARKRILYWQCFSPSCHNSWYHAGDGDYSAWDDFSFTSPLFLIQYYLIFLYFES